LQNGYVTSLQALQQKGTAGLARRSAERYQRGQTGKLLAIQPLSLSQIYGHLFRPMSVSRRQFVGLVSVAWIEDFAAKTSVSRENVSFIGDHLSLLISGRCVKDCSQSLNYSSRGGGSLQVRGLKGESRGGVPDRRRGFSSIQGILLGFCGIVTVFDACSIYPHQAWTNANSKMTVKDHIFYKTSCIEKNTQI